MSLQTMDMPNDRTEPPLVGRGALVVTPSLRKRRSCSASLRTLQLDRAGEHRSVTASKAIVAFLVGRPLAAIAIAAVVVGVLLLVQTHRQQTPVTHRTQRVALTDEQQMQLGAQQYAQTLRTDRARIISSGPKYA